MKMTKNDKQAGAELGQAQAPLGLPKLAITRNKLMNLSLEAFCHIPYKK